MDDVITLEHKQRFDQLVDRYAPPSDVIDQLATIANVGQQRRERFAKNIKVVTLLAWHTDEPRALDEVGCELVAALGIAKDLTVAMARLDWSNDFLAEWRISLIQSDVARIESDLAKAVWLTGIRKRGPGRPSRRDQSPQNLILSLAFEAASSAGGSLAANKNEGGSKNYGTTQPDSDESDPYRGTFGEYWRLLHPFLPRWLERDPALGTLHGLAKELERKHSIAG